MLLYLRVTATRFDPSAGAEETLGEINGYLRRRSGSRLPD